MIILILLFIYSICQLSLTILSLIEDPFIFQFQIAAQTTMEDAVISVFLHQVGTDAHAQTIQHLDLSSCWMSGTVHVSPTNLTY